MPKIDNLLATTTTDMIVRLFVGAGIDGKRSFNNNKEGSSSKNLILLSSNLYLPLEICTHTAGHFGYLETDDWTTILKLHVVSSGSGKDPGLSISVSNETGCAVLRDKVDAD